MAPATGLACRNHSRRDYPGPVYSPDARSENLFSGVEPVGPHARPSTVVVERPVLDSGEAQAVRDPREALARIRDLERPIFEQIPDAAKVVALRNIIIHGYDAVDPKVLWAIVEDRLPELTALLSRLLEEARRQGL